MRQRQNPCVINIRSPAPCLSDWRFRLRPCHHWQGQVRSRKVSLPSGPRSGMSRMLDGTLHRDAEAVGSETDMGRPSPYPSVTSSSGPPCPLSRYRTELQTCSAIEKMRPVDGQRLPSAHPAALTAILKKDWLPPPLTDLPAVNISYYSSKYTRLSWKKVLHSATWVSHPPYTPFSGLHWRPACSVFP